MHIHNGEVMHDWMIRYRQWEDFYTEVYKFTNSYLGFYQIVLQSLQFNHSAITTKFSAKIFGSKDKKILNYNTFKVELTKLQYSYKRLLILDDFCNVSTVTEVS